MRSQLGKSVRRHFDACMKRSLSQFHEIEDAHVLQGCRLHAWDRPPGISFYILLLIDPRRDVFDIEVAWSLGGQWPAHTRLSRPYDEPIEGALRFRADDLWNDPKDVWWWVARQPSMEEMQAALLKGEDWQEPVETAMPRVKPMVEHAIDRLVEFGLPYFDKIAARYANESQV